jgi:hypothetical protein
MLRRLCNKNETFFYEFIFPHKNRYFLLPGDVDLRGRQAALSQFYWPSFAAGSVLARDEFPLPE